MCNAEQLRQLDRYVEKAYKLAEEGEFWLLLRHIHEGLIFLHGVNGVSELEKKVFLVKFLDQTAQILHDRESRMILA